MNCYLVYQKCECLDPTAPTTTTTTPKPAFCPIESYKNDGYCDDSTNTEDCEWDGGDCCGPDVNKEYCQVCTVFKNSRKSSKQMKHKKCTAILFIRNVNARILMEKDLKKLAKPPMMDL